jgi:hypothetical protein
MMARPESTEEAKFRQLKEEFSFGFSIPQLERQLDSYSPNLPSQRDTHRAILAVIADKKKQAETETENE